MIIDVGANTGIYSLVAHAINSKAKIFAFEPISRIYRILSSNLDLNLAREVLGQSSPKIQAIQVALSDYNGSGEMFDLPVEHMYTASLNKDIHLERGNMMKSILEAVVVQRIDHFCAVHDVIPDLVKIDVESHEPAVLRGMGDLLRLYQPTLICEIWDNTVGAAVEEAIGNCGYLYFAIEDTVRETAHVRNETPERGYVNYLFASKKVALSLGLLGP